jgi:hypothetical protein
LEIDVQRSSRRIDMADNTLDRPIDWHGSTNDGLDAIMRITDAH